jgi:signal transduction histidine kinase
VEGFAERSNIPVQLDVSEDLGRMSSELETTVFRIVQECLTNVHRHSGSPSASVQVKIEDETVRVEVRDRGKGMQVIGPGESGDGMRPGVGIQGMRERVRQLGGRLSIDASADGTAVIAILPLVREANVFAKPGHARV